MYSNSYEKIRSMFWDGTQTDKNGVTDVYKLDEYGIKHSIWRALRDYTARTDGIKEGESQASADKMLDAIPKFRKKMISYFDMEKPYNTAEAYDKWHHEMCDLFVNEIVNSKIRSEVKYGKAQKIVNMSMKTIFCLNGAEEKAKKGYFEFCHMPLDSITLNWFRDYVARDWFNTGKKQANQIKRSTEGGPLPKWSSLKFVPENTGKDFKDYCGDIGNYNKNNPYDYMFIVTMIREYFNPEQNSANPYNNLTPFEAEFYIWPETQYEMAAEALINQDLINKLESNADVAVNNSNIKLQNEKMAEILSKLSTYY